MFRWFARDESARHVLDAAGASSHRSEADRGTDLTNLVKVERHLWDVGLHCVLLAAITGGLAGIIVVAALGTHPVPLAEIVWCVLRKSALIARLAASVIVVHARWAHPISRTHARRESQKGQSTQAEVTTSRMSNPQLGPPALVALRPARVVVIATLGAWPAHSASRPRFWSGAPGTQTPRGVAMIRTSWAHPVPATDVGTRRRGPGPRAPVADDPTLEIMIGACCASPVSLHRHHRFRRFCRHLNRANALT